VFRAATLVGLVLALLVPASAGYATTPPHVSKLPAGQALHGGMWLYSPDGLYTLRMQVDGNLVLYWKDRSLWASDTVGHVGDVAVMQGDGNFVIYQGRRAIWSSGSGGHGHGAFYLTVQNDGNVVIYASANKPIWATGTDLALDLQYGSTGYAVKALQTRLATLGYWVGTRDGLFGDSTEQAVWALQKAAGLPTTGIVDAKTAAALERGVVPKPRAAAGYLVEVNLERDLLMVVDNNKVLYTLNTSTGGGYTYYDQGGTYVAETPTGVFHIYAVIDGLDVDTLGALWRPRFFDGGFAIHGDSFVPPYPVSHGCVRVSNEAIDWIWASNIMPIGTEVWVY